MGKLSAASIPGLLKKPGSHMDGDGLFLRVRKPGQGAWIARLQSGGKRRDYGLKSASLVSLSEARELCRAYRKALSEGRDPRVLNRPPKGAVRLFKEVALEFIEAKLSPEGRERARGRLALHAFPKLGKLQLQSIDADTIAECLRPIWQSKPETARKVRILIIRTLRFGLPNGAALIGTLARAVADRLPDQPKGTNFTAMHYARIPEVMSTLEAKGGLGALALRATILCAVRSQEVRLATWDQIDFDNRVWTVPAANTKMKKEHLIPLSEHALAVFGEAAELRRAETDLIFPSFRDGTLSDGTLLKCLRDADAASKAKKTTVHGMRAAFKTWAAERSPFADEVSEAALAHAVPSVVLKAYRRTDFFDQRVELMRAWGAFCGGSTSAEIVQLQRA